MKKTNTTASARPRRRTGSSLQRQGPMPSEAGAIRRRAPSACEIRPSERAVKIRGTVVDSPAGLERRAGGRTRATRYAVVGIASNAASARRGAAWRRRRSGGGGVAVGGRGVLALRTHLIHAVVPRGPQPPASPNCSHRPSRRQCSAPAPAACVATLTRQSASAPPCPHACVACAEKNGPPEKTSEAGSDACSFSGRTRRASWWVPQPPRPNAALPRRLLKTSSIGIVALQHTWFALRHDEVPLWQSAAMQLHVTTIYCAFYDVIVTSSES